MIDAKVRACACNPAASSSEKREEGGRAKELDSSFSRKKMSVDRRPTLNHSEKFPALPIALSSSLLRSPFLEVCAPATRSRSFQEKPTLFLNHGRRRRGCGL